MKTEITVDSHYVGGQISKRLFGSFVEHMGSVVYSGIFEPGHPQSDENGFRKDVLSKVKDLSLGVIRYPGGNYSSVYHWEDTIGPVEDRPTRVEPAWKAIEPNTFGLNEFFKWVKQTGAEPILTVNLGTRGLDSAKDIVEYCNFKGGTYWSELRKQHGVENPYNVKLWCLGNELDGPWQVGRKSAEEYGKLANEAAKLMKRIDGSIETILVGSSTPNLASYPEWDRIALEQAYENVDYLSLHNYIDKYDEVDLTRPPKNSRDDTATYLAKSLRFDREIKEIVATCDYVKALVRSNKTINLAFDEWNVHNQPQKKHSDYIVGSPIDWCYFTMEDTLLFGSLALAILRRADRVKIACQSLLVNTIPLILTDAGGDCWVNPTYYVMMYLSKYAKGEVLNQRKVGPTYDVEKFNNVPMVDSCIVKNEDELVLFLINRSDDAQPVEMTNDFNMAEVIEHVQLRNDDLQAKNTRENPETIQPQSLKKSVELDGDRLFTNLAPYSWNMVRIRLKEQVND